MYSRNPLPPTRHSSSYMHTFFSRAQCIHTVCACMAWLASGTWVHRGTKALLFAGVVLRIPREAIYHGATSIHTQAPPAIEPTDASARNVATALESPAASLSSSS